MPHLRALAPSEWYRLARFFHRVFRPPKAEFLLHHGVWAYRGPENHRVLELDGEIVGFCAWIPVLCNADGEQVEAAWWVDLAILPEARGQGLQRLFDSAIRDAAPLLVGFPNALAARIHLRHGWGVRDDLKVLLLPLDPSRMATARRADGALGAAAAALMHAARPAAKLSARRLLGYQPRFTSQVDVPGLSTLASIAANNYAGTVCTYRTPDWLRWRYFDHPARDQIAFFLARRPETGSRLAVVVRRVLSRGVSVARILDVFGCVADVQLAEDALRTAVRWSLLQGVVQVTIMAGAGGALAPVARRLGFLIGRRMRFCWWTRDECLMHDLARLPLEWGLADADNDEP